MRARILSLAIHALAIALLILVSSQSVLKHKSDGFSGELNVTRTQLVAPSLPTSGGGGGGTRNLLHASHGALPKIARHQFVPPSATPPQFKPVLVMEPTLVAAIEIPMLNPVLAKIGDPFSRDGPASNGPGSNGGIGAGDNGGIGNHSGPGFGQGDKGGVEFGSNTSGGIVQPVVLYKVDPEFSEEARKAKYQGTVVLAIEVGEDGRPRAIRILSGLGLGLDEKAIEAVSRWKFKPAMRNGKPVRAPATIQVNFHLL